MDKPKVILILLGAIIFFGFLHFLSLRYETNDDPLFMFIASGALTHSPDEHLQSINILFGHLFKGLYTAWPQVNWYTGVILGLHLVSLVVYMIAVSYKRNITWWEMLVYIFIILFGYEALFLVKLQFTATAFMTGFAGIIFLFSRFALRWRVLVFTCLFTTAFLLRKEVFIPVLLFALAAAWQIGRENKTAYKFVFTTLALNAAIFLAAVYINNNDPGYKETGYYAYHKATDIICNNALDTSAAVVQKYGWSSSDLGLLKSWYWVDQSVFSADKIIAFSEEAKTWRSPGETVQQIFLFFADERFPLLFVLISLVGVLLAVDDKQTRRLALINGIVAAALLLFLVIAIRTPKRVSTPILFYVALSNMYFLLNQTSKVFWKRLALSALLFLSVIKFWRVCVISETNKREAFLFAAAVEDINQRPGDIFVVTTVAFPMEKMPAWTNTVNLIKHKNLVFTGWFTNMPAYREILKTHGLKDLAGDIRDKQNIVFLHRNDKVNLRGTFRRSLTEFYKDHYGDTVSFTPYEPSLRYIKAYRIHFEEQASLPASSK